MKDICDYYRLDINKIFSKEIKCRCRNGFDYTNATYSSPTGWEGVVPCSHKEIDL